jgi:hypothetical protein
MFRGKDIMPGHGTTKGKRRYACVCRFCCNVVL